MGGWGPSSDPGPLADAPGSEDGPQAPHREPSESHPLSEVSHARSVRETRPGRERDPGSRGRAAVTIRRVFWVGGVLAGVLVAWLLRGMLEAGPLVLAFGAGALLT